MTQTLWHSTSQPDSLVSKLGPGEWSSLAAANWAESGLSDLGVPAVAWACEASNRAQQYSTHGLFRYFGKFPPYVAQELISDYTAPGYVRQRDHCSRSTPGRPRL